MLEKLKSGAVRGIPPALAPGPVLAQHGAMRMSLALLLALLLALPAGAREVLVGPEDLRPAGPLGFLAPRLDLPPVAPGPAVDPADMSPAAALLRRYVAQGVSAGFEGLIYDNRDRGHSALPQALFPALTHLRYAAPLRDQGADYGLAGAILWPLPTLGNSSTALTGGPAARSLPRAAMTFPGGPARAFRTYAANMIHVYPEHRDHDAADLYPGAWPYMVISQGSSGSDQPFLRALALTMAAFRPETRARLVQTGLMAPTLQMLLRKNLAGLYGTEGYLSPAAHPTVFEAERLAPERMVAAAAVLNPGEIPPLVRLTVETEDFEPAAGLAGLSERLYSTPSAIARIWRGWQGRREMVLSAAGTRDPNGRDLRFHWILLRGDPGRVRITPLDAEGLRARIEIDWHDTVALPDGRRGARVDLAAIAWNGAQFSAPALVSVSFPDHQLRRHETGPDGAPRLVEIDYRAEGRDYDPLLHWRADWRDVMIHDAGGTLVAIERHAGETVTRIDPADPPAYRRTGNDWRPELETAPRP
jgi:hypothetical protein